MYDFDFSSNHQWPMSFKENTTTTMTTTTITTTSTRNTLYAYCLSTIISIVVSIIIILLLKKKKTTTTTKSKTKHVNENNNDTCNNLTIEAPPTVSGGWPLLGHAIEFGSNTEGFLRSCREKYGRAFQLNILGRKMVFLDGTFRNDFFALPEKTLSFTKLTMQTLAPEYTFGVDTITNPYHIPLIRRQLIGNNLDQYLSRLETQVKKVITKEIGNFKEVSVKDVIVDNCEILAWKIIASCSASSFMGETISARDDIINVFIEYHKACYEVINAASILPKPLLRFAAKKANEQDVIIRKVVVPEVQRRRQMIASGNIDDLPKDFLTHLSKLKKHSPEDIAKRMMAFIFASMVTSAGALTHAIYDLAGRDDDEVFQVLVREQRDVIAKHGNTLSKDAFDNMPRLHAFVWESMRCAALPIQQGRIVTAKEGVILRSQQEVTTPAKNNTTTTTTTTTTTRSIRIPKGTTLLMSGYLASTDKTTVERSDEFWPSRFLVDDENDGSPTLVSDTASKGFFPFGIGRHYCPGRQFALAEIKGSLCVLLRNYSTSIRTVSGNIPKYNRIPADTLRINEPVRFIATTRTFI